MTTIPSSQQLVQFRSLLEGETYDRSGPLFKRAVEWLRNFPGELSSEEKDELKLLIQHAFGLQDSELKEVLADVSVKRKPVKEASVIEAELMRLIPRGGYLAKYLRFTEHSEAPLAYHLFSALVAVGAIINRRVWFNMGYYRLFPNVSVILIGPSGLKKTSAANIAVSILEELKLVKLYSEKLTPEQLVEAMTSDAQGLLYAPEMSVFLGKQRYNEGLVPLITRFLDCPDLWSSETIMRGKRQLTNIALSSLMCTTPDWFVSNTPEDTFGGGFVARNLLIVQEDSPRVEPIPRPGSVLMRGEIAAELAQIHAIEGEMFMDKQCEDTYNDWYRQAKILYKEPETELLATYYQRKPDHVKRIAMDIHVSQHGSLTMDVECFNRALAILDYMETFLPNMLRKMFKNTSGAEAELVLRIVLNSGGIIDHSELVRKVQYRMNAQLLRNVIQGLKEANQIGEKLDKIQHIYFIKEIHP